MQNVHYTFCAFLTCPISVRRMTGSKWFDQSQRGGFKWTSDHQNKSARSYEKAERFPGNIHKGRRKAFRKGNKVRNIKNFISDNVHCGSEEDSHARALVLNANYRERKGKKP